MKKKGLIIASLLVLVMSFMFFGCDGDPKDEGEEVVTYTPAISSAAQTALAKVWSGTLKVPANTNFGGYYINEENNGPSDFVAIWWTDADADKLVAYAEQWGVIASNVSLAREIEMAKSADTTSKTNNQVSKIAFTVAGGNKTIAADKINYNIPANSIYFTIYSAD